MILKILFFLLILALLFILYLVFRPLWRIRKRKIELNGKLVSYFSPYVGIRTLMTALEKTSNDNLSWLYNFVKEKPDTQAFVTNIRFFTFTSLSSNEYLRLLQMNEGKFERFTAIPMLRGLFGKSLFLSENTVWKRQRKFLGEYFHHDRLRSFSPAIEETCDSIMDELAQSVRNNPEKSEIVPTVTIASRITGEVIVQFFFSGDLKGRKLNGKPVALEIQDLIADVFTEGTKPLNITKGILFGNRFLNGRQKDLMRRVNEMKELANSLMEERRKNNKLDTQKDGNKDLLSAYMVAMDEQKRDASLKENERITLEEIIHQFNFLFFAGTDTTGHLAGVAFYLLAKYPETYEKIEAEIKNHINSGSITYEALAKMDYLHAFVKETLRLYTPASQTFSRKPVADMKLGDLNVTKGDFINANLLMIMRSPKYFTNPDSFEPERWLRNEEKSAEAFSFIPFWAGPKNCMGQHLAMLEAKIIVIKFVNKFRVKLNPAVQFKLGLKFLRGPVDDRLIIVENK